MRISCFETRCFAALGMGLETPVGMMCWRATFHRIYLECS